MNEVNYNHASHIHCYKQKNPACGLKGKHCCLCDICKTPPVAQDEDTPSNEEYVGPESLEEPQSDAWEKFENGVNRVWANGHVPDWANDVKIAILNSARRLLSSQKREVEKEARRSEIEGMLSQEDIGNDTRKVLEARLSSL